MTEPQFREEALNALAFCVAQLSIMRIEFSKHLERQRREHRRRCRLLDDVIQGQRERDARMEKLLDHLLEDEGDWWRKGGQPPWQT